MTDVPTFTTQLINATQPRSILDVRSPYTGEVVGRVHEATTDIIELAFATAERAQSEVLPKLSSADRSAILQKTAALVASNHEDYSMTIALEGGKPLTDARAEVTRAVNTLELSAEVAEALEGETPVMDRTPAGATKTSFIVREPIGVVSSISAFNHPLNLSAHLVGPTFAAGNAVVLKPATATPLCSMKLGQHFLEAGMPPEALSIINCDPPLAELCVTDERIRFLNFIGSEKVGWMLRGKLPVGARLMLEHGGTSPAIVDEEADLDQAARSCVKGGYYHAGQVCVSLQRLYLHESIYDDFMTRFIHLVNELKVGDPTLPETEVGPIIRVQALEKVDTMIQAAVSEGAKLTCGGARLENNCYTPTILENVSDEMRISREEIFGPAVVVNSYVDLSDAIARANDSPYAFQSSIFTRNINKALTAAHRLDSTAVMVNDHPAYRVDWMPFGGRKASGIGMGGVRYAAEEMSQIKLINIHNG